ncbi:MAG TPA: Crp/Fnr family transcriptional regulator [Pseudolabrys sp.]|nr:Crp/Fnr family transcriptional regulator [Pseudolabrys sp.]
MPTAYDIILRKLNAHSPLDPGDEEALRSLPLRMRRLEPDEDLLREGDRPEAVTLVLDGMLARYHALANGKRQYLSFHIAGDLPGAQTLFLDRVDYAVCGVGRAEIASVMHEDLLALFKQRPMIGFAVWRETLVDAAICRQAITNNSSRAPRTRMAHLFCELYYRARSAGLGETKLLQLSLHQAQLGDALGMSLVTVNRSLQALRRTGAIQFRNGLLTVHNWQRLAAIGEFDAAYLHSRAGRL